MSDLFKQLDLYLDTISPPNNNNKKPFCCRGMRIELNEDLGLYSCRSCGVIYKQPYIKDDFDKNKIPGCVKSYIPYTYKHKHLTRLSNWTNYNYKEVTMNNLLKFIDKKMRDDFDSEVIMFSKILFKHKYSDLSIRAKIKNALIVYCIFQTCLSLKRDVDIDNIIRLFNISIKNYNDLNKKLKEDRLYYLYEMNEYLKILNMKDRKNEVIRLYNLFLEKCKKKFMKKSVMLGILYFLNKDEKIKKNFFKIFQISKSSIKNVICFIDKYNVY